MQKLSVVTGLYRRTGLACRSRGVLRDVNGNDVKEEPLFIEILVHRDRVWILPLFYRDRIGGKLVSGRVCQRDVISLEFPLVGLINGCACHFFFVTEQMKFDASFVRAKLICVIVIFKNDVTVELERGAADGGIVCFTGQIHNVQGILIRRHKGSVQGGTVAHHAVFAHFKVYGSSFLVRLRCRGRRRRRRSLCGVSLS